MMRDGNRKADQIRPAVLKPDYILYPEGSVLIQLGNTIVLCNVTIEQGIPPWMRASSQPGGWITAEYSLLPRSTHTRTNRETRGLSGRTQEIRRLVGRALRAGFDLALLGERTCIVDCDVIQADGGTRTAAITGGYAALCLALKKLVKEGKLTPEAFLAPVAAISVGVVAGEPLLDLDYQEDSAAEVDLNLVMNAHQEFIEIQGTAEGAPFSRETLDVLLALGSKGIAEMLAIQKTGIE